jgi:hypothetical protein
MVPLTQLAEFLSKRTPEVLASASVSVARAHLPHYENDGATVTEARLGALYALVVRCAAEHRLGPIAEYASGLAAERRGAGFDLGEVQTAINVLEEAVWRVVMAELPPEDQGQALGVVGTILGAAKDRLGCTYVSLATTAPTHTLHLAELFEGAVEGEATHA